MKYLVMMHVEVDARDARDAQAQANALRDQFRIQLRDPFAQMTLAAAGIHLVDGDGKPVVYNPQPAEGGPNGTQPRAR